MMIRIASFGLAALLATMAAAQQDRSRNIGRTKPLGLENASRDDNRESLPTTRPWQLSFEKYSFGYSRSAPESVRLSVDGKLLAIGCRDKSIRLWDLKTGRELRRLIGHTAAPHSLSFSPDGKRIVSSAASAFPRSSIRVWSVATGEQLFEHKVRTESAAGVEYHPSGKYFVAGIRTIEPSGRYKSNSTEAYDASTFRHLKRLATSRAHRTHYFFSTGGKKLILGPGNGYQAEYIDLATEQRRAFPKGFAAQAFSAKGDYVAGLSKGRSNNSSSVIVLDSNSLSEVRRFEIPKLKNGRLAGSGFRYVRFPADRKSVLATVGQTWIEWSLESGKTLRGGWLESSKSKLDISSDGQRMVELTGKNHVNVWDLGPTRPRVLAKLHVIETDGHWGVETAAGYFQHSEGLAPKLASIARHEALKYSKQFRNTQMVARLLAGMTTADALALPEDGRPPTVNVRVVATEQDSATVEVVARASTPGGDIRDVMVRVNGRDSLGVHKNITRSDTADSGAGTRQERRFRTNAPFPPGQNQATVQVRATDSFGQQSESVSVRIQRPIPVKPVAGRLFVLAVGVSKYRNSQYNLNYCDADAQAIADKLLKQKGRAFGDVQIRVYVNDQATTTNVNAGLNWLQRACTPADVAVVVFSGHGLRKERGLYYLTHEANVNGVQYTCLNWETVAETLKSTRAKQILFFADACHAGAFAQSDLVPQQEIASSLRRAAGVMVFASSRDHEESLENAKWGHGAFCKSILDGLDGKADKNNDGSITILELQQSVTAQVIALTKDRQHPVLPRLGDFDPDLIIAKTR